MSGADLAVRVLGMAVICLCLAVFEPGSSSIWQRVGLPVLMAAGAFALVRNLAAVAFGAAVLALIHSRPGAEDPITAFAYPGIAAAALVAFGWILVRRFRSRIAATRAERWASRGNTPDKP